MHRGIHVSLVVVPLVIGMVLLLFATFSEYWTRLDYSNMRRFDNNPSFAPHNRHNYVVRKVRFEFPKYTSLFGECDEYKLVEILEPVVSRFNISSSSSISSSSRSLSLNEPPTEVVAAAAMATAPQTTKTATTRRTKTTTAATHQPMFDSALATESNDNSGDNDDDQTIADDDDDNGTLLDASEIATTKSAAAAAALASASTPAVAHFRRLISKSDEYAHECLTKEECDTLHQKEGACFCCSNSGGAVSGQFECCFPASKLCDGVSNCKDKSDELHNCPMRKLYYSSRYYDNKHHCLRHQYSLWTFVKQLLAAVNRTNANTTNTTSSSSSTGISDRVDLLALFRSTNYSVRIFLLRLITLASFGVCILFTLLCLLTSVCVTCCKNLGESDDDADEDDRWHRKPAACATGIAIGAAGDDDDGGGGGGGGSGDHRMKQQPAPNAAVAVAGDYAAYALATDEDYDTYSLRGNGGIGGACSGGGAGGSGGNSCGPHHQSHRRRHQGHQARRPSLCCCRCNCLLCPFVLFSLLALVAFVAALFGLAVHVFSLCYVRGAYLVYDAEFVPDHVTQAYQYNPWLFDVQQLGASFYAALAAVACYLIVFVTSTCVSCRIQMSPAWQRRYADSYEVLQMHDLHQVYDAKQQQQQQQHSKKASKRSGKKKSGASKAASDAAAAAAAAAAGHDDDGFMAGNESQALTAGVPRTRITAIDNSYE